MEFKLNGIQKGIQKAATDFAKGEFDKDLSMEMDRNRRFPTDLFRKAADLGFIGIHFDEEVMGGGLGHLETALTAEALCRKDSTVGSALMLAGYGAECLMDNGSRELAKAFLPCLAEGRMLAGAAVPSTSRVHSTWPETLVAEKINGEWVVNGMVRDVINGWTAGFYCVLCRTDSDASPDKAYSLFLVEGDMKGISVSESVSSFGIRMTSIANLTFSDVRLPELNLMGKTGNGLKQLAAFTNKSRVLMAAMALGIGQGALDRSITHVKNREQFGKKIGGFQVNAHKVADMMLGIEQARSLTYQAAWHLNQKKPDPRLMAMAKLAASKTALEASHEAIQLHGGSGFCTEMEVERYCRDAKVLEMLGGSTIALKNDIAAGIIGKIK